MCNTLGAMCSAENSHGAGEEADAAVNNDVAGSPSEEVAGLHQPVVSSLKLKFLSVYSKCLKRHLAYC